MREINRDIVSAIIVSKEGKIFFGKKDPIKGGVYSDCWHIPGGGIDDGEDKIEALKREVLEETGIKIATQNVKLLDDEDTGQSEKVLKDTGEKVLCNMKFNVYIVNINQNSEDIDIKLKDDLVKYSWFTREDLKGIKLTPPGEKLYRKIGWI